MPVVNSWSRSEQLREIWNFKKKRKKKEGLVIGMWIVCLINYKEESRDTVVGDEIPEVSGRGQIM